MNFNFCSFISIDKHWRSSSNSAVATSWFFNSCTTELPPLIVKQLWNRIQMKSFLQVQSFANHNDRNTAGNFFLEISGSAFAFFSPWHFPIHKKLPQSTENVRISFSSVNPMKKSRKKANKKEKQWIRKLSKAQKMSFQSKKKVHF